MTKTQKTFKTNARPYCSQSSTKLTFLTTKNIIITISIGSRLDLHDEIQAEITETKIVFPKDVTDVCDKWVLIEDELDHIMILAKNENITNPIDMYQLVIYVACN